MVAAASLPNTWANRTKMFPHPLQPNTPHILTQQHNGGSPHISVPALPNVRALRLLTHRGKLQATQLGIQLLCVDGDGGGGVCVCV